MAVDNKQIATDVLELVGGAENVTVATNCMTRLRLTLKDNSKADVEKIKKVKGVLGCQFAGSQLQVIIGQNVPKVLAEFVAISGVKQGEAVDENLDAPKEKFELKNLPNIILDYLSGSMTQLIPLLMAGGLFRTIAAVLGPHHARCALGPTTRPIRSSTPRCTRQRLPLSPSTWAMPPLRSSAPLRFWACSSAALSWPRPS